MKLRFILLLVGLNLALITVAAGQEWLSYSSTSTVRYMAYFDDSLQVVTSGGWLRVDRATGGMRKITNDDGLGTNDLNYILKDTSDAVWLAGYGRLIRVKNDITTPFLLFDTDNNLMTLYCAADDNNQLWIGTSGGLALFSKNIDGGQFEDFYYRFDDLDPEPTVSDIFTRNDSIWLATSEGLAFADKSNPDLLKSYASWKAIKPSLLTSSALDSVSSLAFFNQNLYLGTPSGLYRLDINDTDTSLIGIALLDGKRIRHIMPQNDSLFVYTSSGVFVYDRSTWATVSITGIADNNLSSGLIIDGFYWVGSLSSGLYYKTGTLFEKFADGGLPANNVSALIADLQGNVIGGFGKHGLSVFSDEQWNVLDFNRSRDGVMDLLLDDSGNIWVATWGDGVSSIRANTTITFKEDNSTLRGVSEAPAYIAVSCLARASHYIFMLNYNGRDGNAVRVVDMNDITKWGTIGFDDGITDPLSISLAAYEDVIVIGTQDKGLFYYYFGPDPFNKTDDSVTILRESNSWLSSDEIRTIEYDYDGTLWVGTKFGLSQYDVGIDRFVNVVLPAGFGPDVTHLEFDRRGNIWIGSTNGLARFGAGTGNIDLYTSLNSGLLDDYITALAVNPETNDLWVGTPFGISRLESTIGPPTDNISDVIAFPNPFIIRDGGEFLSFNYDGNAVVRIYTVSGELVRETDINLPWDGKNQQGEAVAPGVYLFLLTAEDGSVGRGKILLVRQ
ncbi:MAG: two-component regulator propeller domain-containing protein [Candidatus Zixiibacteriota bacterium]